MLCSIRDITFGRESKQLLNQIEGYYRNGNFLNMFISGGVIIQLFAKNHALPAAYSVSQFDFDLYSLTVASAPKLVRSRVRLAAEITLLYGNISAAERAFWKCIKNAH